MNSDKLKKISLIITIIVIMVALALLSTWLGLNWKNIASGTKLYTESELIDYGEDRYQAGAEKGEEYRVLVDKYKVQVQELEGNVTKITILLETEKAKNDKNEGLISTLETTISNLRNQIQTLQNEVTRLTGLIESYEDIKTGTFEVNFWTEENVLFKTMAVTKGESIPTFEDAPTKENYIFNGWQLNGQNIDFETFTVTENLNIYADFIFDTSGSWMLFFGNENETTEENRSNMLSITDGICNSISGEVNITTLEQYQKFSVKILQSGVEKLSIEIEYNETMHEGSKVYFYKNITETNEFGYTFVYARKIQNGQVVYE